jgi:hypothetical protein
MFAHSGPQLKTEDIDRLFTGFPEEAKDFVHAKNEEFQHTSDSWGRDESTDFQRLQHALQEYLDQEIRNQQTKCEQVANGSLTISDILPLLRGCGVLVSLGFIELHL